MDFTMDIKYSALLAIGLIFGVFLGYLSLSGIKKEVSDENQQDILLSINKKPVENQEYRTEPLVVVSEKQQLDEEKPRIVTTTKESELASFLSESDVNNKFSKLVNIKNIAHCTECIPLLRDYLLSNNLSSDQLQKVTDLLAKGNSPDMASMLLDTVTTMVAQTGYNQRSQFIMDALQKFDSIDVSKSFSDYFVNNQDVSTELQYTLVKIINSTSDRGKVADYIVDQFTLTADDSTRNKLLSINHPESLAKIGALALEQGDKALYTKVIAQIDSNPSEYTFNVLLSMSHEQDSTYQTGDVSLTDTAQQWAYHQLSGSRLDFIENQLTQGLIAETDKPLVLDILQHSEDQTRSSQIIAKFWQRG